LQTSVSIDIAINRVNIAF